jgi:hypothetical protein
MLRDDDVGWLEIAMHHARLLRVQEDESPDDASHDDLQAAHGFTLPGTR